MTERTVVYDNAGVLLETVEIDPDAATITTTVTGESPVVTAAPQDLVDKIKEIEGGEARRLRLEQAVDTLEQWAEDARNTNVTNGNNIQVTQVLVDRLGIFFDRFADLLNERR